MQQFFLFSFLFLVTNLFSQQVEVSGNIFDQSTNEPVEFVTVYIEKTNFATESDINGNYKLTFDRTKKIVVVFTRIGYQEYRKEVKLNKDDSKLTIDVSFIPSESNIKIVVTDKRNEEASTVKEQVSELKLLPSTTGNLESVLPQIALGTTSSTGGELSSQYNVRGGNFDENLVYVNDFEIYRPQLIRAGQQEGLTFANTDLIQNINFSAGGYQAKFGDKMSSVLDIQYKRPEAFKASLGMSFLGGSAHIEGSKPLGGSKYRKFRYLVGSRYKTTKYLLGSLDVKGEYAPTFLDMQGYFTYDITDEWQVELMTNYNSSAFSFRPTERNTALGLINFALGLYSVFEGKEEDSFYTRMVGTALTYIPDREKNPFFLKFLASGYQADEKEGIDIIGYYRLGELDSDPAKEFTGELVNTLGEGAQHTFVRNTLITDVINLEHKGGYELQSFKSENKEINHFLQWGIKYNFERFDDNINEWERLDSAGYSLKYDETQVLVNEVLKVDNELRSNKLSFFVQDGFSIRKDSISEMKLTAGMRWSYWDFTNESLFSPRVQWSYKPLKNINNIVFGLSAGLYFQQPFYKEFRLDNANLNKDIRSQKSAHFVASVTRDFHFFGKDMQFVSEVYYKKLWDLISYDVDNVRIDYSGINDATGYIVGADFRLNGEIVPGAESWVNLSVLRARESLIGVQHLKRKRGESEASPVKTVPRPSDRFVNAAIFFQDYLPSNENFKVHVVFNIGTGFPFGLKGKNKIYRNTYRYSLYHRVDMAFSYLLFDKERLAKKPKHWLRFSKSTWLSLEVFNMLNRQNAASYTWIKTIYNSQYAIPNYLTSRRLNLRLKMEF